MSEHFRPKSSLERNLQRSSSVDQDKQNEDQSTMYKVCVLLIIANIITWLGWLHHRKLASFIDASVEQVELANRWQWAAISSVIATICFSLIMPLVLKTETDAPYVPRWIFPLCFSMLVSAIVIFLIWILGGWVTGFQYW